MKRGRPSLIAGALALLGACASGPPVEPAVPTDPEPQALELRVAGRDAPGFADPERRAKLERAFPNISRAFAELRELEDVPALAVGVVIDGELAYARAMGVADRASGRRVELDTRFRIGSITKVFTALALLRQRDAGALELDAPVMGVVPELGGLVYPSADSRPITFADLLSHSSGLPRLGHPPYWEPGAPPSEAALLASLDGFALERAPGVDYTYSNLGFALLGIALGRVAGEPARAHIDRALLEPLGMEATVWDAAEIPVERRATAYELGPDGQLRATPDWTMGAMAPAGGLYSTIEDLGRFVGWQLDAWPPRDDEEDPILARASSREAQRPHFAHGSNRHGPRSVGWGWQQRRECFGRVVDHSGGTEGFSAKVSLLPDHGVGVIVLANSEAVKISKYTSRALEMLHGTGGLLTRQPTLVDELEPSARAFVAMLADYDAEVDAALTAPILRRTPDLELREAALRWWGEQLGACELGELLEAKAAFHGRYALRCANAKRVELDLRVQPGAPQPIVAHDLRAEDIEASAELGELAAAAAALLEQWNDHGFERSFAPKWTAEGIRGFLERVSETEGRCTLGEVLVVHGRTKATFALDCERRPMTMMVAVTAAGAPTITALEIRAREPRDLCG